MADRSVEQAGLEEKRYPEKPTDRRFHDIEGETFGRWKVGGYRGMKQGSSLWECKCECGTVSVVRSMSLKKARGGSKSCGCLKSEIIRTASLAHGMSYSSEFAIWLGIIDRCFNENDHAYTDYGGRGITMHPEWRESFDAFYKAVGPRPSKQHSIDRYPDNDGGYVPGNVRWATRKEQANNRRSNKLISAFGETKTLMQWGESSGLGWGTINGRLRRGLSPEQAISSPLSTRGHRGENYGVSKHKNRFMAKIRIDGKGKYIGLFKTIEEARDAVLKAKAEYECQPTTPSSKAQEGVSLLF